MIAIVDGKTNGLGGLLALLVVKYPVCRRFWISSDSGMVSLYAIDRRQSIVPKMVRKRGGCAQKRVG